MIAKHDTLTVTSFHDVFPLTLRYPDLDLGCFGIQYSFRALGTPRYHVMISAVPLKFSPRPKEVL